jgi:hypothetical protein
MKQTSEQLKDANLAGYEDFTSYPPLVMAGSLDDCRYTEVEAFKDDEEKRRF